MPAAAWSHLGHLKGLVFGYSVAESARQRFARSRNGIALKQTGHEGERACALRSQDRHHGAEHADNASRPPMATSSKVPVLRRYQYASLQNNRLLIGNPHDKKIADVITR